MATKTRYDEFTQSVQNLLYRYTEDFTIDFFAETKRLAREGAKELRKESRRQFGKGEYAKGWKVYAHEGRLKTTCIIFNEHPSLPHLLENGHATRNGDGKEYKPTPAHEHIKPIEKRLIKEYEDYLKEWFR